MYIGIDAEQQRANAKITSKAPEMFLKLRIAHSHIIAGEPLNQFDSECDKLINLLD